MDKNQEIINSQFKLFFFTISIWFIGSPNLICGSVLPLSGLNSLMIAVASDLKF
jgi:hypothetical protein